MPDGQSLAIAILGLSITSSWGNGHATTYRGLVRELTRRGHRVLFLERDVPWYSANRDLPSPPYCRTELYTSLADLEDRFAHLVRGVDLTVVGSYVPEGDKVGAWAQRTAKGPVAFYDIDTPVTLASLAAGSCEYLTPAVLRRYDLYLSFTGGPTLTHVERHYGVRRARPLYCSADPALYYPEPTPAEERWALGYLGTYSEDRQPTLNELLVEPALALKHQRFAVAGPQYPDSIAWPENVDRIDHIAPSDHRRFYCGQRFTLSVTRRDMRAAGYSPSVRLFEAAACGVPIITDAWEGIPSFFEPGSEILVAASADDVRRALSEIPAEERRSIGLRARERVLREHTAAHRAALLESYARELFDEREHANEREHASERAQSAHPS
jgi:spore maturation protein CgeB